MSPRQKVSHSNNWDVHDFPTPKDYVKQLLDSIASTVHPNYYNPELARKIDGIRFVTGTYGNCKDDKKKELITKAIVELLDDPDYSCDAIPVTAELGLSEAKEWFLNLTKKPVEETRQIKTNAYSNGFGCLLNYTHYYKEFLGYLKSLLVKDDLTIGERLWVLNKIAIHDPNYIFENCKKYVEFLFNSWNESMGDKKFIVYDVLCTAFENSKLEHCLEIAKKMKNEVSKEIQFLYYDSLQKLPAYNPYIQELKKILEISD